MSSARRGEMTDFGRKTEAEAIRDALHRNHDGKFGLTVFRVAYDNDEEFSRFIDLLTKHAHAQLDEDDTGDEIKDLLDWNIQDNKEQLNGASMNEIRDRFNSWVGSVKGPRGSTRYAHCIYADAESISSVVAGDAPGSNTIEDVLRPTAFVKIIDYQYKTKMTQLTADDISDDEERRQYNEGDEGYPAVDGCKRYDVGWMKVAASNLIPRTYEVLMKQRWPSWYVRPPKMQVD